MKRTDFEAWYPEILERLYPIRAAGFAITLIAFPLLERYTRQKARLPWKEGVSDRFFDTVLGLVPDFARRENVASFWKAYRHGLLHQVTLQLETHAGDALPPCGLTHDIDRIFLISKDGTYYLQPVLFAQRVVELIRGDFSTFGGGSKLAPPLPRVRDVEIDVEMKIATVSTSPMIIRGTGTGPDK